MLNRRTFLGAAAVTPAALLGAHALAAEKEDKSSDDGRPHFRAKQILGSKVSIDNDQSVGTVDDIVIDQDGNVDYLIVIDKDRKLVSIPWDAAQFDAEDRRAVVHISPAKYQKIPTYTVDDYPTYGTPAYRNQTYQYFGLTPHQQRRLMRRGGVVITK